MENGKGYGNHYVPIDKNGIVLEMPMVKQERFNSL